MKLDEEQCTAWATDENPPDPCGFSATFANPRTEAPYGDPEFVAGFLSARCENLDMLSEEIVHMATMASAPAPSIQAFSCVLRSCSSQIVGHLLRLIPPYQTERMAKPTDERLMAAACVLMGIEELPEIQ